VLLRDKAIMVVILEEISARSTPNWLQCGLA
jgi:hypothetical protein